MSYLVVNLLKLDSELALEATLELNYDLVSLNNAFMCDCGHV